MRTTAGRAILTFVLILALCSPVVSSPVKPAISMEIKGPGKPVQPGPLTIRIEIVAKIQVASVNVKAYMDKMPAQTTPQPPLALNRGDRRSVDVILQITDRKEHWFFAEAEVTLLSGERLSVMKSLVLNPSKSGKSNKPDTTYDTYRAEKPHK
ncbi:MAG: hypothetical protein AB1714_07200 [Acidobacteriota bacterium]